MTLQDFRRARWALTIAIGAIALLFVALRGAEASAGEVAQASRAKTVSIVDFAFRPSKLTVAAGTKVSFANTGNAPHTATRAGSFDTGTISPGRSKTIKFSRKGSFAYHCSIHPSMHGKIVVK
jgi:plastocyanin